MSSTSDLGKSVEFLGEMFVFTAFDVSSQYFAEDSYSLHCKFQIFISWKKAAVKF